MQIFLGSDHAGFEMKNKIMEHLSNSSNTITDCGPFEYDAADDYPDLIRPTVEKVSKNGGVGIILGGSGQGEAIVANRIANIRAVVYNSDNLEIIKLARDHNDANVLSIGARFLSEEAALKAVDTFLSTTFSMDERHVRRINKIDSI